jgi:hypothetical protein
MRAHTDSPVLATLGRLTWMLLGPLALVVTAFAIVSKGQGWLTSADLAFFIVLAVLPLGRWLEFRHGSPLTATGEPATPTHLRRYAAVVAASGLGVWCLANLLANHWLPR